MTKEEKIQYAVSLLQEAGVDFRVGSVRFENTKTNNPALEHSAKLFNDALLDEQKRQIDELQKKAGKYANKLADACIEIRELKEKLANVTVNNVNAQALKSAENALKEKDEVIDDLAKEIGHLYNMVHGDPILKMKERNKRKRGKKPYAKKSDVLPTEDNPEEIEISEAMKRIRKALKEGKTVIVDEECSADIINMNL